VKGFFFRGHRRFLFRTYLYLVAGLLLTAVVLDMGFGYLQSTQSPEEDRWIDTTLRLLERELRATPEAERPAVTLQMSKSTGFNVELMNRDEIVAPAAATTNITTLVDADGNTFYLRDAPAVGGLIRLGPIPPQRDRFFINLLPPLFYLSIFVVVGLWLRPLLKDLKRITNAAQRFAADYREPFKIADKTSQLTGLASNLDEMSARLSGLIRSQKELIAALSHEMRTPLARIRFALAVMRDQNGEDIQEQLDGLNDDVLEIDQLIGSMLSYARLDHPELRMTWQSVPLDEWLRQTAAKCQQPGTTLSIVNDARLEFAEMDPILMGLALSNLLVNACRYGKHAVCCTVSCRDQQYRIVVEDDGDGVPDSQRESIFKAFTRIDDSRNRETGGYGLGLAIVARIAALHEGRVFVDRSAKLGGAMFTIVWNRTRAGIGYLSQ
jgi:two-component system OmpR family sensor kinase/two-component system sensor histidine kinase RstB